MNNILSNNEQDTNKIIARVFPSFILGLIIFYIIDLLGVFGDKYKNTSLLLPFIICGIILILPKVLYSFNINGWWIKYFNMTIAIILVAVLYYLLTGDAVILFPLPIVLSSLYFNKNLTIYTFLISTPVYAFLNYLLSTNHLTDPWSTKIITISVFFVVVFRITIKCNRLLNDLVDSEQQKKLLDKVSELLNNSKNVSREVNDSVNNLLIITENAKKSNEEIFLNAKEAVNSSKNSLENSDNISKNIIDVMENITSIDTFAKDINTTSSKIDSLIKSSNNKINSSMGHIELLSNINDESLQTINKLIEEFNNINIIIETINAISKQTKLLSLNASIEAARSGEYGLGFNVVAEEIGKLAEQTNNSTRNISELIEKIRSNSQNVDEVMQKGYRAIDDTIREFESVNNSFKEIVNIEEDMNKNIYEISQRIGEISKNSDKTIGDASNISVSTQTVIDSMEEITLVTKSQLELNKKIFELVQQISNTTNRLVEQE